MRTGSHNTDVRVQADGYSQAGGKTNLRKFSLTGGDLNCVVTGTPTITFPGVDSTLGIAPLQWSSGAITASISSPFAQEITVTSRAGYDFPPVMVLRFVTDSSDGRWRVCAPGFDYNVEFFGGNTMRIELYASGSYKVNY